MKKSRVLAGLLTVVVLLAGCGKNSPDSDVESETLVSEKSQTMVQEGNNVVTSGRTGKDSGGLFPGSGSTRDTGRA